MSGAISTRRRRGASPTTVVGLVLLLVGLSILGWAAWQFFGTNITSRRQAEQTTAQLQQQWRTADAKTPEFSSADGQPVALLRIPDLGPDHQWPVLAGTSTDALSQGVGWYADTAGPGQVGNFAVAGHRVTHGEPFRRLLELKQGSTVVVETRDSVYTYALDNAPRELTVADTASWVLDPVPGRPAQKPSRELITLTTCQDLFHSPDRSVAFGHLVSKTDKKPAR
ncbi:class E sortase [Luteococcus peritonei]|uniref:Class E sortase n=1 Tax=Luteococcus peritonei TaxID=88874 RepID=A0ABW4RTL6_9ACTN